ncbi:winged helix-turn-helix domain-containing protein [Thermoanaerobacterium sp. RBIITD]|uniref:winged helix-turn-helix domain-containing protein n=1 Tax=Thermoanaerobacterium sp. RBIITD TaxID=1550240 RepID=UPI000BB86698|nr:winged helix-turn-helix domain-containing protein [Thermoanaerobacterium sp. RBIITD]
MLPLLKLISDNKLYNNKYCEEKLAKEFGLTDEELNKKLQGGAKVFYNRLGWAKNYLKNACLIEFPQRGQELLKENHININSKYLMKYREYQEFAEFSEDVMEYAKRLTSKKIILIDGYQLAEFMIDFNVGVSIQETYEIKRLDTDYFEE